MEQVAEALASIHTGVLLVAAQLSRPVHVPSLVLCDSALCFQNLQRPPQDCCRQHQFLKFLSASLWEGYASEVLLKYHSLLNM